MMKTEGCQTVDGPGEGADERKGGDGNVEDENNTGRLIRSK